MDRVLGMQNLRLILLASTLAFGAACSDSDANDGNSNANTKPDLAGTWRTECQAQTNNGQTSYLTFEISDATGRPRFTVTSYGDAACTVPVFQLSNESSRTLGEPVPTAPGAFELDVKFERLFVKPLADGALGFLGSAGCGESLTVGEERDVSATGCLFFKPIADCAYDYDIVKVEGDRLFNGVRGGDQCVPAGRPTSLNRWWFQKT
jgi:hypothetical protein